MIQRIGWAIFTGAWAVFGGMLTGRFADYYMEVLEVAPTFYSPTAIRFTRVGFMFLGVLVGWLLGTLAYRKMVDLTAQIGRLSLYDQLVGVLGGLIGLIIATLIWLPLLGRVEIAYSLPIFAIVAIAATLGGVTWVRRLASELVQQFPALARLVYQTGEERPRHRPKLLDTSVIIDGRIRDLCETGFLEGPLYICDSVVAEVKRLADSRDEMTKARGRRGLQTLERLRSEFPHLISMLDNPLPPGAQGEGVDAQLIVLAKRMGADLITHDRDLARAAEVQGVRALNINRLVLSLRPEYVQGEEITVRLIRQGTEPGQGVGYLDDGTMVVVSDGAAHINEVVTVTVTTIYQTSAGRMVFAEMKRPPQP